jgi:uncharacterized protein YjbI with pentapeptide repeats
MKNNIHLFVRLSIRDMTLGRQPIYSDSIFNLIEAYKDYQKSNKIIKILNSTVSRLKRKFILKNKQEPFEEIDSRIKYSTYLRGVNLSNTNLDNSNFEAAYLPEANFSHSSCRNTNFNSADLRKSTFVNSSLSNASFIKADLEEAELIKSNPYAANFHYAILKGANLNGVNANEANFSDADFGISFCSSIDFSNKIENTVQFKRTKINNAWISSACFSNAFMSEVEMSETTLSKSKFIRTNLSKSELNKSNLSQADLTGVNLENSNLENVNFFDATFTREGKYRGIRLQGSYGSARFERFAKDQNYLEEIKSSGFRGKILYNLWNIIADCGRTPYRWLLWSSIIIFGFGALYSTYPLIKGGNHTPFTPYYFSIVTFTTLGFGDVTPTNLAGEILVAFEVVIGYVMMGGLISIMATIIARRAE